MRLLAVDMGGTHTRFGRCWLDASGLHLLAVRHCPTGEIADSASALAAAHGEYAPLAPEADTPALAAALAPNWRPDCSVWAVAGPVTPTAAGGRCALSNAAVRLDAAALGAAGRVRLVNDFAAQAWACRSPATRETLLPGQAEAGGALGVIGAGTGLGMALLAPVDCAPPGMPLWQAVSSEAGHMSFAFAEDEAALGAFLHREYGLCAPRCEDVLSGRGLERIHHFVSGERLAAAEVAAVALREASPTARLFARLYGRMCRQWLLCGRCSGGLYVSGGVAVKNPRVVHSPEFAAALRDPTAPAWVHTVPVYLLTDPLAGLWGAARAAQALGEAATA